MPAVDAEMVLVAEHRDRDLGRRRAPAARSVPAGRLRPRLMRPAAVGVHLRPLRLRPAFGHAAALDRRLLVPGEPRPPGLDDGGVDDLPAHGEVAGVAQGGIEALANRRSMAPARVSCSRNSQMVLASGTRSSSASPTKRMNESRSLDLVLGLVVRERVERLQHQHLEHQHRIVGRPAAPGPVRAIERRVQLGPEQLEVDHRRQPLERIARRRQRRIPLVQIEEPRLTRAYAPPATTYGRESHSDPHPLVVFRGVRLTRLDAGPATDHRRNGHRRPGRATDTGPAKTSPSRGAPAAHQPGARGPGAR